MRRATLLLVLLAAAARGDWVSDHVPAAALDEARLARSSWVLDHIPPECFPPEASDLEGFAQRWRADEQVEVLAVHRKRIERLRALRGWEGGVWERALEENDLWLDYWRTVQAANSCREEPVQRQLLLRLKWLVGPERYLKRWAPPFVPEESSAAEIETAGRDNP